MNIKLQKVKDTLKFIKYKHSSDNCIAVIYIKKGLSSGDELEVILNAVQGKEEGQEKEVVVIG